MLPSYAETMLITLFGGMGGSVCETSHFAGIKKRCWHSMGGME